MHITWRTLWPTKALLFQLIRLGLPSGLTQAVFSLAMLVVQSLTNSFGTTIIAVSTVVMRVDGFAMMPNFTFGTATTTFTGQNIGAGRLDRVEKGTKDGLKLGLSRFRGTCCADPVLRPLSHGNVYEYAGRH